MLRRSCDAEQARLSCSATTPQAGLAVQVSCADVSSLTWRRRGPEPPPHRSSVSHCVRCTETFSDPSEAYRSARRAHRLRAAATDDSSSTAACYKATSKQKCDRLPEQLKLSACQVVSGRGVHKKLGCSPCGCRSDCDISKHLHERHTVADCLGFLC